jgi:thiamine biosynthesis lipoprotein
VSPIHRFAHDAMNTTFEVRACHEHEGYARQAAHAAFGLVDRLEQELSRFVPNSDVSRINDLEEGGSTRVSPSTLDCLQIARQLFDLTGGAFDVSIGTGLDALELLSDEHVVRAGAAGVRLDLGGIGKGYAVDRMAALLEEWGIERALVHGGWSSVVTLEPPPGEEGWTLTLRGADPAAPVLERLRVRQRALSASGTRQREHILDPRTGRPVGRGAVWVALPRGLDGGRSPAAVAEGLSTAFMVLPEEATAELCRANPVLEVYRAPVS